MIFQKFFLLTLPKSLTDFFWFYRTCHSLSQSSCVHNFFLAYWDRMVALQLIGWILWSLKCLFFRQKFQLSHKLSLPSPLMSQSHHNLWFDLTCFSFFKILLLWSKAYVTFRMSSHGNVLASIIHIKSKKVQFVFIFRQTK